MRQVALSGQIGIGTVLRYHTFLSMGRPANGLGKLYGVYDMSRQGLKYSFSVDSDAMTKVMEMLLPLGIKSLTVEPPSLEELFMRHYGDDIGEKGGAAR